MKFTYYTIIGRDPTLLDGHLNNVTEYAGFNKLECDKRLLVIVYRNPTIPEETTQEIFKICDKYEAQYVVYNEPHSNFIQNLYACWNLGYQMAHDGYIFRGGSDQVFSKDSFVHLHSLAEQIRQDTPEEKFILQANTIENESRIKQIGATSRHFTVDFGTTFDSFDYDAFERFIEEMNGGVENKALTIEECLRHWGKPTPLTTTLGHINRVDGCSWLMTKGDWEEYGPLPVMWRGVTGDVVIHDILQVNGYKEFMARDCITYHFVRGESIEVQ